jgi:RNase adapter protein RapZ
VIDCRFLPNPHWVDELRPLTGLDEPVRDYVLGQPETKEFLDKLEELFGLLLPLYVREGKSYLSIGVGCTGGHHRSVVLAEELARRIGDTGFNPLVVHRDVNR